MIKKSFVLKKSSVSSIIFGVLLIAFGITFAILGSGIIGNNSSGWIETQSKIIKIVGQTVTVAFVVGGQTIEAVSNYYDSRMKIGDTLKIKYNPKNPTEIDAVNQSIRMVFVIPGIVISVIGLIVILLSIRQKILLKKHTSNEQKVLESISNVNQNTPFSTNKPGIKTSFTSKALPTALFEYKTLDDTNKVLFRFRAKKDDSFNYTTEDRNGNVIYYTEMLSENKYKLSDSNKKNRTTAVLIESISMPNSSEKDESFAIKINEKNLKDFFEERRVTFDCEDGEKGKVYKLYNNLNVIAELYEIIYDEDSSDDSNERMLLILTNKETIDDASLFALCISKRKGHEIGKVEVKK